MKKLVNSILVSMAILTILSITNLVGAQKEGEIVNSTAQKNVEYFLPYPGILPGNPLYPLKMIRDGILQLFIKDPIKKAEFFLLMADKRVNAGKFLIDYGKISLGEPTISKGQNYFDKALEIVSKEKEQGKNVQTLIDRLNKAAQKHEQVLQEILLKVPESAKPGIRNAIERAKKDQVTTKELMGKNQK